MLFRSASSFAFSVLEILPVHPCGRFLSSNYLQNLLYLFYLYKGCICRPLFNKIGFTRFGLHLQEIWQFRFYGLDLVRRWSGVSGPKDPESPVPRFSLPNDLLWCATGLGSGGTPEVVRSLRSTGVSGPKDPESPASSFSLIFAFVWRGTG